MGLTQNTTFPLKTGSTLAGWGDENGNRWIMLSAKRYIIFSINRDSTIMILLASIQRTEFSRIPLQCKTWYYWFSDNTWCKNGWYEGLMQFQLAGDYLNKSRPTIIFRYLKKLLWHLYLSTILGTAYGLTLRSKRNIIGNIPVYFRICLNSGLLATFRCCGFAIGGMIRTNPTRRMKHEFSSKK